MLSVRVLIIILSSVVVIVVVRILVIAMMIFKRPLAHVTRLTGFSRSVVRVIIRIRIHDVSASLTTIRRRRVLNRRLIRARVYGHPGVMMQSTLMLPS
jgi:hypothetical protein